ncbi:MAG TPA: apolipoprotein N-acyltransferase [Fimbriimonadaceae bacterium]|nr:apolipoprotein N-acyltransferase [Fimbriimonadaceae bacterium]
MTGLIDVKRSLPVLGSAVLLSAAFHPLNLGLLVFVALVPWLLSLQSADSRPMRSGFSFGLAVSLFQMSWITTLVSKWTGGTVFGVLISIAAAFIVASFYAFLGVAVKACWQLNKPWLIPVVWAGFEVLRSSLPGLAFPWGLIHTPLWPYPYLGQLAFFGTAFLVSALIVLVNVCLALALDGKGWAVLRRYVYITLALFVVSFGWYERQVAVESKTVVLAQPGVDLAFGGTAAMSQLPATVEALLHGATLANPDLVVLPEGLAVIGNASNPTLPFSIPSGLPVILGVKRGSGPTYQSALASDGQGQWLVADKTRLVAFGEYVPFRNLIPGVVSWLRLPGGDLTPGDKVTQVQVQDLNLGPMICFEALFWDVAHQHAQGGANALVSMCLDDWFMGTIAPDQLKAAAVWRSIETGLPGLRSASLGYSLACDYRGNMLIEIPLNASVPAKVEVPVPLNPVRNPMRPLFPWFASLLAIGFAIYGMLPRQETTSQTAG